jgi:hypothetical protein
VTRTHWVLAILLIGAFHAYGLRHFGTPIPFEEHTEHHDAVIMVQRIEEAKNPWKWFVSDWPLYNGFYRPLPSLAFELDHALFGTNLVRFLILNHLVAIACSFLVTWFAWELFRRPGASVACGAVFAAWQAGVQEALPVATIGWLTALSLVARALLQDRGSTVRWLVVAGIVAYAFRELSAELALADSTRQSFSYRVIGWSPGRTATILTLFALLCCAAYCRFERERQARWCVVSLIALVGAFLSYEQCVVVAPILLACGIALALQGVRVRWWFHALSWVLTLAYVALHRTFLPPNTRYRMQAARGAAGGIRDIVRFLFPASRDAYILWSSLDVGPALFMLPLPYAAAAQLAANSIAWVQARRQWLPLVFGLVVSTGAYAPMSFQHFLAHYYHLPMAIRAILVVWLFILAWELSLSAASHQASRARQGLARVPG